MTQQGFFGAKKHENHFRNAHLITIFDFYSNLLLMRNTIPKISVCIPAHNEEKFIERCLQSVISAANYADIEVEIIVCLNRCTDKTEEIALKYGAVVVREDEKSIAKVRNRAVSKARGEFIATIDADSWMSENMLDEIVKNLDENNTIGGGVAVQPERLSIGIIFSGIIIALMLARNWISAGLFWLRKTDFVQLGGFDESILTGEDLDFAYRLKELGKKKGKPFKTIFKAKIFTSCRKFDHFGDWYLLRSPQITKQFLDGKNQEVADKYYHEFPR